VTFTLVITDFGLPKVIGGQFNVLAVDIYKQVIGQQNFEMGAVVSVVLLIPAIIAFTVDRIIQRRQQSTLSARSVPFAPHPNAMADRLALVFCILVAVFIAGILLVCQFAALVKLWPYDLSFGLKNYDFSRTDGGGWEAYFNSMRMALYVALIGTGVVFIGAYIVEKLQGMKTGRNLLHMLAIMPLAVPGMVLGLSYIFFFNDPANPLNFLYGTMAILVISSITHFYTVSHLTAVTALKQLDPEFESVSASLKQPAWRLFSRVTVPVCMPPLLDIFIYLFVNAMTTVSAVVFLYSPATKLASVAVLNMDDAGDVASAAAMGMMIFYTNITARGLHYLASRGLTAAHASLAAAIRWNERPGASSPEGDANLSPERQRWSEPISTPRLANFSKRMRAYFFRQSLSTPCLNVLTGSSGSHITDVQGRRILDFHGNSVHQVGYGHPKVVAAVKQAMDELPFSPRRYTNRYAIGLARRLSQLAPMRDAKVLFAPSGAAAISMALKLARHATGRHKTLSMWDAFHGANLDSIAVGGEALFRANAGRNDAGLRACAAAGPCLALLWRDGRAHERLADYIDYVLEVQGDVAAVLAEPMRWTTVEPPPPDFWPRVRRSCTRTARF
jgi:ABC-type spermidine/putrescine transport system permease subunit II